MCPTSRRSKILLAYNGKTYSIKELSKDSGVPTYVIAARHEKNWPVERILAEPFQPKPRQFLTYQGVTLSQCAWAKKLGIRQTTISARMQKGLPVEMVLTTGRVPRLLPPTLKFIPHRQREIWYNMSDLPQGGIIWMRGKRSALSDGFPVTFAFGTWVKRH